MKTSNQKRTAVIVGAVCEFFFLVILFISTGGFSDIDLSEPEELFGVLVFAAAVFLIPFGIVKLIEMVRRRGRKSGVQNR